MKILSLFFKLLSFLPARLVTFLSEVFSALFLYFPSKTKTNLMRNIEKIYALPSQTVFAKGFAQQVLTHQIVATIEYFQYLASPEKFIVEGLEELKQNLQKIESAQGQILVTAHLGNWEILGGFCARMSKRDFFAFAKPPRYAILAKSMQKMREQLGQKVLWVFGSSYLVEAMRALKNGAWLGLVIDQKPKGKQGIEVQFFSHSLDFVSGPATFARRFNLGIVSAYCVRIHERHYRVFSRIVVNVGEAQNFDEVILTQRLADDVEQAIRLYPEQWCWQYRRWTWERYSPPPS